jgi:hypothetical protein
VDVEHIHVDAFIERHSASPSYLPETGQPWSHFQQFIQPWPINLLDLEW